jgi:hypothetical protein
MAKSAASKRVTTIKQAIDSFLLSCKVEGKSCRAEEFLWGDSSKCYSELSWVPVYKRSLLKLE